jgi:di/tricarboxylate transporter
MTTEIAFMLLLMTAALVAFVKEIFPIEVTALGVLAILVATRTIAVRDALTGFSSTAVIAIGSLFVLSHALTKTGLLETIADWVGDHAQNRPWQVVVWLLVAVGLGSGFLNNTAVVAIAIPLVMKLCRRLDLSPSKLLMPISFASILGGTLTLIGTSTNLLVDSLIQDAGQPPLGMFEFSVLGSALLIVGLIYVVATSRRLLPARVAPTGALTDRYLGHGFLTELVIEDGSQLIGTNPSELHIRERYGVTVLEVVRNPSETHVDDVGTLSFRRGDHLVVQGGLEDILRLRRDLGLALLPDVEPGDERLAEGGQLLVEAWIAPGSRMIGRTLKQLDFHHHYGAFVLAVRRIGETLRTRLGDVALRVADALLILAPRDRIEDLEVEGDVKVLTEHDVHLRRRPLWWLILIVLPLVIAIAALGWMDIAGAALVGAVALLLARVITPQEAYRSMNWPVLFMIAAFVPVGHAFQVTGTADFLAQGLLAASRWAPDRLAPYLLLALLYLATSILTQIASNNAAAVVLAPVALSLGPSLGADPRPFVIAVCFAASAAFLTPMGYQTNLMVYAAGGYRFSDYARFGTPLSLLTWLLATLLIPVIWPFFG